MARLKALIDGTELIVAPVALNPIMARLAEEAGFKAVYLSGGSLGWLKCVTEANLTLPELAEVAVEGAAVERGDTSFPVRTAEGQRRAHRGRDGTPPRRHHGH